jgi:hypothetical protein
MLLPEAQVVRMSRAEAALESRWCWLESREGVEARVV